MSVYIESFIIFISIRDSIVLRNQDLLLAGIEA